MKISWLLFGLLIAICLVLVILLFIGEPPESKPFAHPKHESMLQAPDGMTRHGGIRYLGWVLGILQFCFFAFLISLCLNKQGRLKIFIMPLIVCTGLCIAAFSLTMSAYGTFAQEGSIRLIGSFPLPTAIMLYGLWPIQILFMLIYVKYYDKAIFTAEDQEKFNALVKSRQGHLEEGS